jgi:hypothetical protein
VARAGVSHVAIDVPCPVCGAQRDEECRGELQDPVQLDTAHRYHKERIRAAGVATRDANLIRKEESKE